MADKWEATTKQGWQEGTGGIYTQKGLNNYLRQQGIDPTSDEWINYYASQVNNGDIFNTGISRVDANALLSGWNNYQQEQKNKAAEAEAQQKVEEIKQAEIANGATEEQAESVAQAEAQRIKDEADPSAAKLREFGIENPTGGTIGKDDMWTYSMTPKDSSDLRNEYYKWMQDVYGDNAFKAQYELNNFQQQDLTGYSTPVSYEEWLEAYNKKNANDLQGGLNTVNDSGTINDTGNDTIKGADTVAQSEMATKLSEINQAKQDAAQEAQQQARQNYLGNASAGINRSRAGMLSSNDANSQTNVANNYNANRQLGTSTQNDYLQKMAQANALDTQASNLNKATGWNMASGALQGMGSGAAVGATMGLSDERAKEAPDNKPIDENLLREQIRQFKTLYKKLQQLKEDK